MSGPFHDHFSTVAGRYADFRPSYPQALFDYLATLAATDSMVWDCACGNGQASVDLASRFHRVIATDASKEQIASASRMRGSNIGLRLRSKADCRIKRPAWYSCAGAALVQLRPLLCRGETGGEARRSHRGLGLRHQHR